MTVGLCFYIVFISIKLLCGTTFLWKWNLLFGTQVIILITTGYTFLQETNAKVEAKITATNTIFFIGNRFQILSYKYINILRKKSFYEK